MPKYLTRQQHPIPAIVQEIFHFLQAKEVAILLAQSQKITLKKNDTLFREGDPGNSFYIILSGKLRATKHTKHKKVEYVLSHWRAGDIIGEMNLIEDFPRGVTLKASRQSTLMEFSIAMIKQYPEIYHKASQYFAKKTVQRLQYLSEVTVLSMEKELAENKKRNALGLMMVTVLAIMCIYMLVLPFLGNLNLHLPITTIISAPLVLILVAIMFIVLKKSGYPWQTYGISLKNWRSHTVEAVLLSIPLIIIFMAAKWLVIHLVLHNPKLPLFNPTSSLPGAFNWKLYLLSLLSYIIISPGQEFIVRGALQSGFYAFLPGARKKRIWIAIIISNLIFSTPHLFFSPYFALVVLVPGIFWGWLYARQKTLVGVSASHIFIGVWMIFIVGIDQIILQLGNFYR